jgi:serine/threonine protein kinase
MTLERGTLVNHRYRIMEILGQGGMGAVYRAMDENLGVEVALKENLFRSEEYASQFRREATILANLRHPNLPRVTDHFVIENQGQYLVMDYIEGEDLRQRMDRQGVLSEKEVITIGVAMCEALSYLDTRTQPIVHRDIKPGNVKITPAGQIYLVDFGLAKIIEVNQMTATGARAMTPGYSPPEQYGTTRTDHRSDLYSLGATLYAAITGSIPEDALARAMGQMELTPINQRRPKISQDLACVLEKALSIRPEDRYTNARMFKQALLEVAHDQSSQPPEDLAEPISSDNEMLEINSSVGKGNNTSPPDTSFWNIAQPKNPPHPGLKPKSIRSFIIPGIVTILIIVVLLVSSNLPKWVGLVSPIISRTKTVTITDDLIANNTTITSLPGLVSPEGTLLTKTNEMVQNIPQTVTRIPTKAIPASPTVEPQPTPVGGGGGEIAFASDRSGIVQVWVIRLDGSNLTQITEMPEGACQPDWSPDGMKLVFVSPCDGNDESYPGAGLFIINYDGTNLTPLPNVPGGDFDPAWSPDGQSIVFTSQRVSGRSRLYLIDLNTYITVRLSEQYSRDMQPAWSSDGQKIAYVSRSEGPSDVWIMNKDGSNQVPFTRSGFNITSPDWALDENVILFTQTDKPGGVPHLTAASKNEGIYNEYELDLGPVPAREAKYSPDGLWIVFESWPDGKNHDIFISSANGAGRTQLTDFPSVEFDPVWRPVVANP